MLSTTSPLLVICVTWLYSNGGSSGNERYASNCLRLAVINTTTFQVRMSVLHILDAPVFILSYDGHFEALSLAHLQITDISRGKPVFNIRLDDDSLQCTLRGYPARHNDKGEPLVHEVDVLGGSNALDLDAEQLQFRY